MTLEVGLEGSVVRIVGDADTASAMGSGDVAVLGTPRLVAWCEAATVDAVAAFLAPGATTVGTNVTIDHLAATSVGGEVTASAVLTDIDGRRLRFEVSATCNDEVIARGSVSRAVVQRDTFIARLG